MLKTIYAQFKRVLLRRFINYLRVQKLILAGVRMDRPRTITIGGSVTLVGNEITIRDSVMFDGDVTLSRGSTIEQNCQLSDCLIEENATVRANSIIEESTIGENSFAGPFARIRQSTKIGMNCQIGNFVEIKNSNIGDDCKINHLAFVGDAIVGESVIIGAGSVTCNFDGFKIQKTNIKEKAFIGSGVYLVAPVTIGESATIGTGSVITADVPGQKLTLARPRQVTIENWNGPRSRTSE